MATTTNYGWTTPDDTALVKDGAAAIRSLGSSIDTTTKNLNPSTTLGDLEYRSSTANTNTRIPIGTSGQGLQVVAGVPAWAASSTSTLTTTGDILYASAANTLARRAIGSTGDVLTVSGGLPTWAAPASGGMTSIASGTLSSTEVSIGSIPSTYVDLYLVLTGFYVTSGTHQLSYRVNSNTGNHYNTSVRSGSSTLNNVSSVTYFDPTSGEINMATSASNHSSWFYIRNYTSSGFFKTYQMGYANSSSAFPVYHTFSANQSVTAAISSIQIRTVAGTGTFGGGTYTLYGVK